MDRQNLEVGIKRKQYQHNNNLKHLWHGFLLMKTIPFINK